jgi:hypothetical protein
MHERDFQAPGLGPATAPFASMKYLLLLGGVAIIYFVLVRNAPVASVKEAITASEVAPLTTGPRAAAPVPGAPTTSLKSPIDRTHAALDQVKSRNGDGEF